MRAYNNEFVGKTCVLIGCSRTTGVQIANRYAEEGMRVVIADLNTDIVNIAKDVQRCFPDTKVEGYVLDVTDECAVEAFFKYVEDTCGRIDMLHYNAGVIAPLKPVTELETKYYDLLYKVNVRGVAWAIKYGAEIMKKQDGGGSIVTTSSWYGRKGYAEAAAYCSSKAACIVLTQVAAIDLGPFGIRVNTIAPGDVESPMTFDSMKIKAEHDGIAFEDLMKARCDQHPLRKIATFTEVANIALWLSSSQCTHTTGQTVYCDGGANLLF